MTFPLVSILLAIAITYLAKVPVAIAMAKESRYDNRDPRAQQQRLTGWGKRAVAAQQNGYEVFPVFASCVLISHLTNANLSVVSTLCGLFLVSRIVFIAAYLSDQSTLRSTAWGIGIFSSVAIATVSLWI